MPGQRRQAAISPPKPPACWESSFAGGVATRMLRISVIGLRNEAWAHLRRSRRRARNRRLHGDSQDPRGVEAPDIH